MADAWGASWGASSAWANSWGTSGVTPTPPAVTTGGWLSEEQVRALRKRERRAEREEVLRRAAIKAKARELEDTIEEAYARATGKKRTANALEGTEKPQNAPPEQLVAIAQDVAARLSGALAGSGKRYSRDRELLAQINGTMAEIERLIEIEDGRRAEDDEAAVMLLLMVM